MTCWMPGKTKDILKEIEVDMKEEDVEESQSYPFAQ